jgi:hypothetical protein
LPKHIPQILVLVQDSPQTNGGNGKGPGTRLKLRDLCSSGIRVIHPFGGRKRHAMRAARPLNATSRASGKLCQQLQPHHRTISIAAISAIAAIAAIAAIGVIGAIGVISSSKT